MKKILLLMLAMGCVSAWAEKEGGSEAGNGGDLFREERDAAWFLNEHEIRFCVRSKGFAVDAEVLRKKIEWAYAKWGEYYDTKAASEELNAYRRTPKVEISFKTRFDSSCSSDTDVVFIFGEEDSEVESVRKYYSDPLGFAHRSSFDIKNGVSKGFVWIAKDRVDWTKNQSLDAILLHEIGHTVGVPHVAGTIMSEKIAHLILKDKLGDEATEIDHWTELTYFPQVKTYQGVISASLENSQQSFEILTGRKPQGEIRASARILLDRDIIPWTIQFEDEIGSYPMQFDLDPGSVGYSNITAHGFKVALPRKDDKVEIRKVSVVAGTLAGTLAAPTGTKYDVVLEYNMHYSEEAIDKKDLITDPKLKHVPFRMYFFANHKKRSLFGPSAYWMLRGIDL